MNETTFPMPLCKLLIWRLIKPFDRYGWRVCSITPTCTVVLSSPIPCRISLCTYLPPSVTEQGNSTAKCILEGFLISSKFIKQLFGFYYVVSMPIIIRNFFYKFFKRFFSCLKITRSLKNVYQCEVCLCCK